MVIVPRWAQARDEGRDDQYLLVVNFEGGVETPMDE
jgi:hypothetical protein